MEAHLTPERLLGLPPPSIKLFERLHERVAFYITQLALRAQLAAIGASPDGDWL